LALFKQFSIFFHVVEKMAPKWQNKDKISTKWHKMTDQNWNDKKNNKKTTKKWQTKLKWQKMKKTNDKKMTK
jgi:16S rRNA G1207 methylase RsmC